MKNYHYKSYLEESLNYGTDARSAHLITNVLFPDTAIDDGYLKLTLPTVVTPED
jgi:hypothetical protein